MQSKQIKRAEKISALKNVYDIKRIVRYARFLSILSALFLPLISVFGTTVAVFFNKYIKIYKKFCIALRTAFSRYHACARCKRPVLKSSAEVMLICLSVISLFTSGTNNIITSMLPLYYKDKANAGLLAEMLNGCCYVWSTLSSYGLGLIADNEVRTKTRLKYLRIYDIVFFCRGRVFLDKQ